MQIAFWMRRALLAAIVLLGLAWLAAFADQWWLRWRGHKLLAEVRSIEVGKTSEADVRRLIAEWNSARLREVHYCPDEGCDYGALYFTHLPEHPIGYPDKGIRNWLPRLASRMGLRRSGVMADLKVKDGVVVSKSFAEVVGLPPRVWFDRKGAWVPDLMVSSREVKQVGRYDGDRVYPHRAVRSFEGE
jgi:hypothetical protein